MKHIKHFTHVGRIELIGEVEDAVNEFTAKLNKRFIDDKDIDIQIISISNGVLYTVVWNDGEMPKDSMVVR